MSAVADLINKLLRQHSVYFQGLDLRAKISRVGISQIPLITLTVHVWVIRGHSVQWFDDCSCILLLFLSEIEKTKHKNKTELTYLHM